MSYTIQQKYDLSKLKPVLENQQYALYTFGNINEDTKKGVRLNKLNKEQVDVIIKMKPKVQVVAFIRDGLIQKLM